MSPSEPASRRLPGLVVGALLLASIAAFWTFRIVLSGHEIRPLGDDLAMYYFPSYAFAYEQGAFVPLWNPFQLCGVPSFAALQGGLLYPGHILHVLLPTATAIAASGLVHLALIGLSVLAFARRAGFGWEAALLAALLCSIRGNAPALLHAPNALEAAAWLAPGALGVLELVRGRTAAGALLLAVATGASWLAGYPQATVYALYTWGALAVFLLIGEGVGLRPALRAALAFAGGVVVGSLVAGVQLLPTLELVRSGTRSLSALPEITMLLVVLEGRSILDSLYATLQYRDVVPSLPLSLGVVSLALIPAAVLAKRRRTLVFATLGLGLITVGFAMGPVTPLFDVYLALPALESFRFPKRILFVTDFCFAIAAAAALDVVRRRVASSDGESAAPAFLVGGVALLLALLWWMADFIESAIFASAMALLAFAAALVPPLRSRPALAAGLVVALGVAEIFSAPPNRYRLSYDMEGPLAAYTEERESYARVASSHDRVWIVGRGPLPRLPPKVASLHRMRSLDDYEPLNLRRQAEYFGYLVRGTTEQPEVPQPYSGRLLLPSPRGDSDALATRSRLLDLAAMRYLLVPKVLMLGPELASYVKASGMERVGAPGDDAVLFENARALPRAFVTYRSLAAPEPEELLARLATHDFDPLAGSYVEGSPTRELPHAMSRRGHSATIVRDDATLVEVEAELAAPGLLVLADSFYPGWRASANGEPLEIFPTNHLFRGVLLDAGHHRVRFEYQPASLRLGAAASAAGALGLCALAYLRLRSPEHHPNRVGVSEVSGTRTFTAS